MTGYVDPRLNWARIEVATDVLRRVTRVLESARVDVLPVKGIVTSRLLYNDPSERPIRDIDVRVSRKHLRTVIEIARANGWKVRADSPRLFEAVLGVDDLQVDVECTLGVPGLCAVSVEEVIARARHAVAPFPHLQPELHDHALILVLNAFKDGLRTTPWALEDLRRVVRLPTFDPGLLIARARDGQVLSALWLVADWMSESDSFGEWKALRRLVGAKAPAQSVARRYVSLMRSGWSGRRAHVVVATSSDSLPRRAAGLVIAVAGIARRRVVLAGKLAISGR